MQRCQLFCLIIKEYISRLTHTSNKALTLSWRRSLSYRNQAIDLLCKLMEWFLYDKDIRHEKLIRSSFIILTSKVCSYMSLSRISFFCLFSIRFFFHKYHDSQDSRGKGRLLLFWSSLYHFYPLYRHLDISQVIAAKGSPLCIAGSRTQTRNLWFPIGSC